LFGGAIQVVFVFLAVMVGGRQKKKCGKGAETEGGGRGQGRGGEAKTREIFCCGGVFGRGPSGNLYRGTTGGVFSSPNGKENHKK